MFLHQRHAEGERKCKLIHHPPMAEPTVLAVTHEDACGRLKDLQHYRPLTMQQIVNLRSNKNANKKYYYNST